MAGKKLSTDPYKGVRDFYPEDMYTLRYLFDTMSRVAESFGYSEYGASILEPSELYRSKTSEEIVSEQTYSFVDRGGREVTLRPEMTPTIARMVVARRMELPFPLRWYSIPNVFRYERSQRGRLREHYQLNVDLFGVPGLDAEVEMIMLASEVMKSFGATENDFEIRVSDRNLFTSIFDECNIPEDLRAHIMRLLDKKDKIENFEDALHELAPEYAKRFLELLSKVSGTVALETLIGRLKELGITNAVIDPSIVRGFDYYNGIVFEVYDTSPENSRALCGGGRYDNLLELFGIDSIPAIGFGMGDVRILDFLETHNLLPKYSAPADVFLCTLTEGAKEFAAALAKDMRANDVHVEVSLSNKKVGDQIKLADKKKIPFVICIGENEMRTGEMTIKHLASGKEAVVTKDTVADYVFSNIS